MSNNNNIQSSLNMPENPNDVWNAEEINAERIRINSFVDNNIQGSLLNTDTIQTVSGQKTFTNLFFSGNSTSSYNSVMDSLNNDISPLSGNGYKAIVNTQSPSESEIKRFALIDSNRSGRIAPLAKNNPIFIKSNVSIKSSDNDNIIVTANNIPLSAYDTYKGGTPPNQNGSASAKFWNTSVNYSGTINKSAFIGGLQTSINTSQAYSIIIAKKDSSTTADCLVVMYGSEGSIDSDYKSFKKIGFCVTSGTGSSANIFRFVISNNTYIPGSLINSSSTSIYLMLDPSDLGNGSNTSPYPTTNLSKIIKSSCIIDILPCNITSAVAELPVKVSDSTYSTITGMPRTGKQDYLRIPMVWDGSSFYSASIQDIPASAYCLLTKIQFGSLQ